MSNSKDDPNRGLTFFGVPRSRLGWWSIGLAITFVVLFMLWWLYISWRTIPRPTFFSDPLHACLYIGATAAAITGGILGVLAFVAKRERSFLIVLSALLGAVVLYWTIGTLAGLNR
jgi:hypothetical protein